MLVDSADFYNYLYNYIVLYVFFQVYKNTYVPFLNFSIPPAHLAFSFIFRFHHFAILFIADFLPPFPLGMALSPKRCLTRFFTAAARPPHKVRAIYDTQILCISINNKHIFIYIYPYVRVAPDD